MAQLDYLGDRAANMRLINLIQNFWKKRGYKVRAWVEKADDPQGGAYIWVIKTDITQSLVGLRSAYTVI